MADTIFYSGNTSEDAVLVLFDKNGWIGSHPLGVCTVIGRQSENSRCDIQIASPIVSRNHGEIGFNGGKCFYRDLESTNGTYYNNKLLGKNSPEGKKSAILSDGDILSFDIRNGNEHHASCVNALFCTGKNVLEQWKKLALDSRIAEICIGRSGQKGITIDSPVISEKHASFFCSKNGWAIIDHNSTNGVFLNGKRLKSPRYLNEMDVVRIADIYFIFLGDSLLFSEGIICMDNEPASSTVPEVQNPPCIETPAVNPKRNVQEDDSDGLKIHIVERSAFQWFRKVMLLRDIDINIAKGQMVLILGGSGAGKTTFMNAVTGYEKAVGRITYEDTDIYQEYERMKYDIGFVPQQDLIRSSDTVYATLANAADMKLPRYLSMKEVRSRIEDVLEELGLSAEKNKLVSKLSGGQKKRLSIAVEYIADPGLFFLDEPDSGLDNAMGRGLMENLRCIADKGKIIMVITHSPERAADLFDKVIVLAKSIKDNCGRLAFYGSIDEAFSFFDESTFGGILKKINRPDENGEGLSDFYIEKYSEMKGE